MCYFFFYFVYSYVCVMELTEASSCKFECNNRFHLIQRLIAQVTGASHPDTVALSRVKKTQLINEVKCASLRQGGKNVSVKKI